MISGIMHIQPWFIPSGITVEWMYIIPHLARMWNNACSSQVPGHQSVFINEPRLSDFKQVLLREGIQAEFVGGVLVCNNLVAVRRVSGIRLHLTICKSSVMSVWLVDRTLWGVQSGVIFSCVRGLICVAKKTNLDPAIPGCCLSNTFMPFLKNSSIIIKMVSIICNTL